MTSFDFRRSDHQRNRDESLCLSEIDEFLKDGEEPFLSHDMSLELFDNILENEVFKSALGSIVGEDLFDEVVQDDDVDVITVQNEGLVSSSSPDESRSPKSSTEDPQSPSSQSDAVQSSEQPKGNIEAEVPRNSRKSTGDKLKQSDRKKSRKKSKKHRSKDRDVEKSSEKIKKKKSSHKSSRSSNETQRWLGAHETSGEKSEARSKSQTKPSKACIPSLNVALPKISNSLSTYKIPKTTSSTNSAPRRTILLPPVATCVGSRRIVNLDHDYCIRPETLGEDDDFNVVPMDVEPEEEKAVSRIEVLPDLSLAAREKVITLSAPAVARPSSRSLLKVNQKPEKFEEDVLLVYNEEVVMTTVNESLSDSGLDCVRLEVPTEGEQTERQSRKRYRGARSRRRQYNSSGSSAFSTDGDDSRSRSREPSKRRKYEQKSESRRRRTSKGSYPSDDQSRSRSRCSSPEQSSDGSSRFNRLKRTNRRNIWCTEPSSSRTGHPGTDIRKTAMREALDKIRRGGDRKVIYVGRIPEGTTRLQLREWFVKFGEIAEVSLHFRDTGENYGFVTFLRADDAYQAVEHGNDDPTVPKFQLCFGGRRQFCGQQWHDLDGQPEREYMGEERNDPDSRNDLRNGSDFDSLLNSIRGGRR